MGEQDMGNSELIYKITSRAAWANAETAGVFFGAEIDLTDGYIHFSSKEQAVETAAKHFAGQDDLLLVAVEGHSFGSTLKWEPSRGGALFPHLYEPLPTNAVKWVKPLPLGSDGKHIFPDMNG